MLFLFLQIVFALLLLYVGSELFVKSAYRFAIFCNVRPFLIGLTILAFATSLPEAVTSSIAQLKTDAGDIAIGNVIGSNIANIGLVLGFSLLIRPLKSTKFLKTRDLPILMIATVLLGLMMIKKEITRVDAAILLLVFAVILAFQIYSHRNGHKKAENLPGKPLWDIFLMLISISIVLFGADLFVSSGQSIAKVFDIPQRIIGLTLIALGTSLPELTTSIVAAFRNKEDLAIGNVIGSNIFNALLVVALAALIKPISFDPRFFSFDLPVMVAFTGFIWLCSFRAYLSRYIGALLVIGYILYIYAIA